MRQPPDSIASVPSTATRTVTRPEPKEKPMKVPKSSQLPRKPRRRSGAYSAM